MYTHTNFKTKKELKEAVKAGEQVTCFQPGPFPGTVTGRDVIEGPHGFHRWYASVDISNGVITKVRS
jgi:hypothetical protein